MAFVSVRADIAAATKTLGAFASKQIPYATALAINDVAFQIQRAETDAIKATFKSPRPFTAKSVQVQKATKAKQVAMVFIRPEVAKYLDPYEFGGEHVLPGAKLLNPVDQRVDAFGQLTKGTAKRLAARKDVFIGTIDGVRGFWQRLSASQAKLSSRRLKLLIAFGVNQPVNKRLNFEKHGEVMVRKLMPVALKVSILKALASA
jgi:hypothetical protein